MNEVVTRLKQRHELDLRHKFLHCSCIPILQGALTIFWIYQVAQIFDWAITGCVPNLDSEPRPQHDSSFETIQPAADETATNEAEAEQDYSGGEHAVELPSRTNRSAKPATYFESFANYVKRYNAQAAMQRADLPISLLRKTFSALPHLTKLVFSDWRQLGRRGESYDRCARRIFGATLAPTVFIDQSDTEFLGVVCATMDMPVSICMR